MCVQLGLWHLGNESSVFCRFVSVCRVCFVALTWGSKKTDRVGCRGGGGKLSKTFSVQFLFKKYKCIMVMCGLV